MQSKWLMNSYNREANSNVKIKPGVFSNRQMNPKISQDMPSYKPTMSYNGSESRLSRDRSASNISPDILSKPHGHINNENQIYVSNLEPHMSNFNYDQHNYNNELHPRPLAERNSNQGIQRDNRNQTSSYAGLHENGKQSKGVENSYAKPQKQVAQQQSSNGRVIARNNSSRSPVGYSDKKAIEVKNNATSIKKPSQKTVNDENHNKDAQLTVPRSHSTLALRPATEVKRRVDSQQLNDRSPTPNEETSNLLKLKKENQDLWNSVNRLNNDLQNERNKCITLETEAENFREDIIKEREKYKDELFKISSQIKKLRNIQNIYVIEKKNSERLENQLNIKEKALSDSAHLLSENLKTMFAVLESLLLKGDISLEKQLKNNDFNPETMFRLFCEIRRQIVARIEEAENFRFNFDWRDDNYREILSNSKDLIKTKRKNSFKVGNTAHTESDLYYMEKKSLMTCSSYNSGNKHTATTNNGHSPVFAQTFNDHSPHTNAHNVFKKDEESSNHNQSKKYIGGEDHKAQKPPQHHKPQQVDEYIPLNVRVNLGNINMNIQEEVSNVGDINANSKSLEDLNDESFIKKRAASVSKYWEGDFNIADNLMTGSLGSTIVPRTNNCSGFNETFENLLGENTGPKFSAEEKKYIGDSASANNSKSYDLPMAVSNFAQIHKSNNDLESVKNKILQRKQSIEARRLSSAQYDQNFLQQPGITENSEESLTSFQKTVEEDSLQRNSYKTKDYDGEAIQSDDLYEQKYQQPMMLENGNSSSRGSYQQNFYPNSEVDNDSKNEPQPESRMIRSTSALTVGMNQAQKANSVSATHRKEQEPIRSRTEESRRETHADEQEEEAKPDRPDAKTQNIEYANAKFDYNAQKENDLSFNKGDKIRILRKTETGWWIGLCNNKIGYFPYNFVTVTENS